MSESLVALIWGQISYQWNIKHSIQLLVKLKMPAKNKVNKCCNVKVNIQRFLSNISHMHIVLAMGVEKVLVCRTNWGLLRTRKLNFLWKKSTLAKKTWRKYIKKNKPLAIFIILFSTNGFFKVKDTSVLRPVIYKRELNCSWSHESDFTTLPYAIP